MSFLSRYLPFVAAMALVVVASNVLVQFPMQGSLGALSLADILTWGAFTYPFSFLVTDLANRRYGPAVARRIVFVGFMTAVVCSIVVPPLLFRLGLVGFETQAARLARIAMASGAGLILAGIFQAPAGLGFPPGTAADLQPVMDTGAKLHSAGFMLAFGSLIVACFIFATGFWQAGLSGCAVLSIAAGLAIPAFIAAGISNSMAPGVAFYVAAVLAWLWLGALAWQRTGHIATI